MAILNAAIVAGADACITLLLDLIVTAGSVSIPIGLSVPLFTLLVTLPIPVVVVLLLVLLVVVVVVVVIIIVIIIIAARAIFRVPLLRIDGIVLLQWRQGRQRQRRWRADAQAAVAAGAARHGDSARG